MSHNEMMTGYAVEIELNYEISDFVKEELSDNFHKEYTEEMQLYYDWVADKVLCVYLLEYQWEFLGSVIARTDTDQLIGMEVEFIDYLNKHGDVKKMKTVPKFFVISWYNGSDMDAIL